MSKRQIAILRSYNPFITECFWNWVEQKYNVKIANYYLRIKTRVK